MRDVPVTYMDKQRAEQAWEAHSALLRAEAANPALRDNPVWKCLRMDAYEAFRSAFVRA